MSDAHYPDELLYHDQHDWARLDGDDHAVFGITWYAKDASYAEVESVKAVSDVIAPMSGEIVEVNDSLEDTPEKINEDPYGEGWLVKVKLTQPEERGALLGADEYRKMLEKA